MVLNFFINQAAELKFRYLEEHLKNKKCHMLIFLKSKNVYF